MRPLDYVDDALEEAEAAARWYAERSPAAAASFTDEIDAAVAAIQHGPETWPLHVMGTTALAAGVAVPLFEAHLLTGGAAGFTQQYDVARDGRFLLNVPVEDATAASITVVVNWEAGLKK